MPGRLQVREHEYSAALVYSHLTKLGWAQSLPRDNILAGAARCLTERVARCQQRRLPLEFYLATDLKHLPLDGNADPSRLCPGTRDATDRTAGADPEAGEVNTPKAGRFVWRALHRGLGLLGDIVRHSACLHLLAMYYWQGEEDEEQALKDLKAQGEDISQVEMIRRADVGRQFPSG